MKPCTSSTLTSSPIASPTSAHSASVLNTAAGRLASRPFIAAGRDQGREADDVGDGEVQAADEDHEGLADRDQAEDAHRGEDGPDVALAEEVAALDGGQHGGDHDDARPARGRSIGSSQLLGPARSRGAPTAYGLAALHARSRVGCLPAPASCRGGAHAASSLAAPVAMASTASSLGSRRELAGDDAVTHDQDPVGHADHLGELAGDHQHGDALAGQLAHQLVDAVLGTDVDAARGLVHEHDQRVDAQPAGEHDLLLVAAGEELHLLAQAVGGTSRLERRPACRAGHGPYDAGRRRARRRARCRGSTG